MCLFIIWLWLNVGPALRGMMSPIFISSRKSTNTPSIGLNHSLEDLIINKKFSQLMLKVCKISNKSKEVALLTCTTCSD